MPNHPFPSEASSHADAAHESWASVQTFAAGFFERVQAQLSSETVWYQVAAVGGALALGYLVSRPFDEWCSKFVEAAGQHPRTAKTYAALKSLVPATLIAGILWALVAGYASLGLPVFVMRTAGSLLVAWIIIRTSSSLLNDTFSVWLIATIAWLMAGLNILGLFEPLITYLGTVYIPGTTQLSFLDAFWAAVVAVGLIWGASFLSKILEARLRVTPGLTPSVRGLLSQIVKIGLISAAIVFALSTIGIDLTAFAVFSGAIGVGIGFGLQSIFSNFVAGIIIIFERTLNVGDFVDLESGTRGEVREINIRSTLITTNDNIDILVPNSEFINNKVTNWTLRDVLRRIRVPVGVAYGSDKDLVKKALLEAADKVDFTLKGIPGRAPDVWLVNFGESSLDFELVVWLTAEAVKKPARVHAAYCWEIETALTKYGLVIPFPQRDLHIIPAPAAEA